MHVSIYGAQVIACNSGRQEDMNQALHIRDGRIVASRDRIDDQPQRVLNIDASGLLALPGIIDIHSTVLNRLPSAMPGISGTLGASLAEADQKFARNGITTAYHSSSYSWDNSVRSRETTTRLLVELDAHRSALAIDHRINFRFEKHYVEALVDVMRWIAEGKIDFLVMTDRLSAVARDVTERSGLATMAHRAGCDASTFLERLETVQNHRGHLSSILSMIATTCRNRKIPVAMHGDMHHQQLDDFALRGIRISELPRSDWAIRAAFENQATVVLSASDHLRSRPCHARKSSVNVAQNGDDKIFVSEGSPASLFLLPFHLAASGICALESAWETVSSRPARAIGLYDRGRIAAGCRGDVVIVEKVTNGAVRLVATIAAGQLVYCSEPERLDTLHCNVESSQAVCA